MTLPQLEQFIKDNIQQSVKAAIIIGAVRKHLLARADERDNKWISVEERLPDIKPGYDYSERVIVVDKNKYIYNSTFWEFSQTPGCEPQAWLFGYTGVDACLPQGDGVQEPAPAYRGQYLAAEPTRNRGKSTQ